MLVAFTNFSHPPNPLNQTTDQLIQTTNPSLHPTLQLNISLTTTQPLLTNTPPPIANRLTVANSPFPFNLQSI